MKQIIWFKPNKHWNVITEKVYYVLVRHYPEEFFKVTHED